MAVVPASARSRRVEPKSNEGLSASARICTKGVRMSLDCGHGKRTTPQQRPGASGGGGGHEPAVTTRGTPHGASGGWDGATPNWIRPWVPRIRRGECRIRIRWPAEVKGRRGLWPGGGGRQGKREVGGRAEPSRPLPLPGPSPQPAAATEGGGGRARCGRRRCVRGGAKTVHSGESK